MLLDTLDIQLMRHDVNGVPPDAGNGHGTQIANGTENGNGNDRDSLLYCLGDVDHREYDMRPRGIEDRLSGWTRAADEILYSGVRDP